MGMLKKETQHPGNTEENRFRLLVDAPKANGRISDHPGGSVLY